MATTYLRTSVLPTCMAAQIRVAAAIYILAVRQAVVYHNIILERQKGKKNHKLMVDLGFETIMRVRSLAAVDQDRPLFIHKKMATAGARSYILPSSRYPIVPDRRVRTLAQLLTLFMENTLLLFHGSLDVDHRNLPGLPKQRWLAIYSQKVSKLLWPKDFPAPPWYEQSVTHASGGKAN